jgi:hypothetical protein
MTQEDVEQPNVALLKEVERLRKEVARYEINSDEDSLGEADT